MYDVIIVGGSFAGLSAALQLGRARRRVLVLDTGLPRNRFAAHSHGFLTRDGAPPLELLAEARRQLDIYPTVELRAGLVCAASRVDGGFEVELEGGERLAGHRLILAYGMTDEPDLVPGMAACWGKTVFFCPYCHGFEFADRPLGLLWRIGDARELARFYKEWTADFTLFTNGAPVDAEAREALAAMAVRLNEDTILSLDHTTGELEAVITTAGRVKLAALFTHPPMHFSSNIGIDLGCETRDGGLGAYLAVDFQQETTVSGVFAAGDIARPAPSVSYAVADGVGAGVFAHRSLLSLHA